MSQIMDILQGHVMELVGANEDLSATRLKICRDCPIYTENANWGPMCSSNLYINEDGDVSNVRREGFTKGCGCRLRAKTRNINASCIIGKW